MLFSNRIDAGRRLAAALAEYRTSNAIVLALPRGGVVVGFEVASALGLPLEVFITRKLGAPGNPEYAIGALSETGRLEVNEGELEWMHLDQRFVAEETAAQQEEIRRRVELYRAGRPLPDLRGRTVIVVDDGIATGFTVLATLRAVRALAPGHIVLAVPVAPSSTLAVMRGETDRVVCLYTPEPFFAVGAWYADFEQVTDDTVCALLAAKRAAGYGRDIS